MQFNQLKRREFIDSARRRGCCLATARAATAAGADATDRRAHGASCRRSDIAPSRRGLCAGAAGTRLAGRQQCADRLSLARSTVSFLLKRLRNYRPRPLMQIGYVWNRPFESLQREGCASVFDRIRECHADELLPDRLSHGPIDSVEREFPGGHFCHLASFPNAQCINARTAVLLGRLEGDRLALVITGALRPT